MKLIVHTESGSEYLFDNDALTWSRKNTDPGHEQILFGGDLPDRLAAPVQPEVGERLTFFLADHDWVVTTPVVSVKEIA